MKNAYLETGDRSRCYGCGICAIKCPSHAIEMEVDGRGFLYPQINKQKCSDCGICEKVCPEKSQKNNHIGELYAVEHKQKEVLVKSQSGGAFTAISDYILNHGGVVYGAALNAGLNVIHIRAESFEERDKMRGSKYVQSIMTQDILKRIENDIHDKKYVLFTGTPCQCAAVKKNWGSKDNLIVCDFICHGTPSPKVWKDYLEYVRKKTGKEIKAAYFRIQEQEGKGHHTERLITEDEMEYISIDFAGLFYTHLAHRESCFSCQFADIHRCSDITIGGYLDYGRKGIKENLGVSMCFINSEKGKFVFDNILDSINCERKEAVFFKNQPCLYNPVHKEGMYEKFWQDYGKIDFKDLLRRYVTDEVKRKYRLILGGGYKHIGIIGIKNAFEIIFAEER